MDSRVAVQTSSTRHHGDVYVQAGAAVARALASGTVHVDVAKVAETLRSAQDAGADPKDVARAVGRDWAWLGDVLALVIPRSPEAFWAFVAAILSALALAASPTPSLNEEELAKAIADALREANLEPKSIDAPDGVANWPEWKH